MTRKHFEAIAKILKEARPPNKSIIAVRHATAEEEMWQAIRDHIADYFAEQNEHFNREKFMEACKP